MTTEPVEIPIGAIKTFGKDGIAYIVESPGEQLANGDWLVNICLLESNERTQYRLSRLIKDPLAE